MGRKSEKSKRMEQSGEILMLSALPSRKVLDERLFMGGVGSVRKYALGNEWGKSPAKLRGCSKQKRNEPKR
jgi:hypothetical protein